VVKNHKKYYKIIYIIQMIIRQLFLPQGMRQRPRRKLDSGQSAIGKKIGGKRK
jgi:hypothetical protein